MRAEILLGREVVAAVVQQGGFGAGPRGHLVEQLADLGHRPVRVDRAPRVGVPDLGEAQAAGVAVAVALVDGQDLAAVGRRPAEEPAQLVGPRRPVPRVKMKESMPASRRIWGIWARCPKESGM